MRDTISDRLQQLFLPMDGSRAMTGQLRLSGDPAEDRDAARKAYVDAQREAAIARALAMDNALALPGSDLDGRYKPREEFPVSFVVAASNSHPRPDADYFCTGVRDNLVIQKAINDLPTENVTGEPWTPVFERFDAFDAVGGWVGINGDEALASDAIDKKAGIASLKIVGGTTDNPGAKLVGLASLDWSAYNCIQLWVKMDAIAWVQLKVVDGSGYTHVYEDRILYANTWTDVQFDLRDPYKVETYANARFDWADVVELHLSVVTTTNGYTVRFDDVRLQEWYQMDYDGWVWQTDSVSGSTRGTDYVVSFRDGRIKAIVGGNLTSGVAVDVDYERHLGGTVLLTEGDYYLDSFVDYTRVASAVFYGISLNSYTTLRGQGEATVLKVTDTVLNDLVPVLACQVRGVRIESLTLDGNTPTVSNVCTGIQLRNSRSCRITDVFIKRTTNHFIGVHGSQDVEISGCKTEPYYDNPEPTHGIDGDHQSGSGDKPEQGWWGYRGCRNIRVVNNEIYNHSSNVSYGQAFKIENGRDIVFADNSVRGMVSVHSPDSTRFRTQNITITGNTITEDNYIGLKAGARDGGLVISHNTLNNTGMIIHNHANGENSEVLVEGNGFFNPPYHGIHIVSCLAGDVINVKNNILHGDGRDYGIHVDSIGVINIEGNTLHSFGEGIRVATTATGGVVLDNNTTYGCTSAVSVRADKVSVSRHHSNADGNIELYGSEHSSIEDCTIRNNIGWQAIRVAGSSHHALITGNKVYDSEKRGICIESGDDCMVSNNLVVASSQDADATHPNIRVSGVARTTVIGNTLRHGGGAKQPNYGLYITGTYTRVKDNDLYAAGKTANVGVWATTTIFGDNPGWEPTQVISAVGNTILANAETVKLNPALNVILASLPTIAAGGMIGMTLRIMIDDAEPNTVTLQDEAVLPGSKLKLLANQRALVANGMLGLVWNGVYWVEEYFK